MDLGAIFSVMLVVAGVIGVYAFIGLITQSLTGWDDYPLLYTVFWPVLLVIAFLLEIKEFIEDEIIERFKNRKE